MQIHPLEQGSPEWHAFRADHAMASETAALFGRSPWFPQTPLQLWELKNGFAEVADNPAMRHGRQREAEARRAFEQEHDAPLEPIVASRGLLAASLDGIVKGDNDFLTEIKAPFGGTESDTFQMALRTDDVVTVDDAGMVLPWHYFYQVQHQMYVCELDYAAFYVWTPSDSVTLWVEADKPTQAQIVAVWEQFFENHMEPHLPPEPTEGDIVTREDAEFVEAVRDWLAADANAKAATEAKDHFRDKLIELAGDQSCEAEGVRVLRYFRRGPVDYQRALKESGVTIDIEQHRKAGRYQHRVSKVKDND